MESVSTKKSSKMDRGTILAGAICFAGKIGLPGLSLWTSARPGWAVCSIALAYFDLAAISLGLGCFWDGFFTGAANSFAPIRDGIQLPDGHQIFGSLALGYPKYKYRRIPVRKPASISWQ